MNALIPMIRKDLIDISKRVRGAGLHIEADELKDIADELKRRPAVRRAPRSSTPMTPAVAAHIRRVAYANPTWSQQRIADHVGVNHGRVSETLRGKRGER